MKKTLFLLLFPVCLFGQHIHGTVNGENTTISTEFLRYAVPNGSKTILVFDNRQNVIFDQNILSVVSGSCGDLYSTTISKKGNSFSVGDVVAPCVNFVNKAVQNGTGSILLTKDPSVTFYVSNTYANVNTWLTTCGSGGGGGSPTGAAGGDLNGTYPSPTVDGLQGRPLAATAPINGQAVIWNGSTWLPGTPTLAGGASGDLTGLYPSPTVIGLQGQPIDNAVPDINDVLVFDGSQWTPSTVPYQHWFNTDLVQDSSRAHDGDGFDFAVTNQNSLYWQTNTGINLTTGTFDTYSDITKIRGIDKVELYTAALLEIDIPTKSNPNGSPLVKLDSDGTAEWASYGYDATGLSDGETWVYDEGLSQFLPSSAVGNNFFNADLTQDADYSHDMATHSIVVDNGTNLEWIVQNAMHLYGWNSMIVESDGIAEVSGGDGVQITSALNSLYINTNEISNGAGEDYSLLFRINAVDGQIATSTYSFLPEVINVVDDGMYVRYDFSTNSFVMDTPAGGGADNWGTQEVEHGTTLTGDGTLATPLDVATDGITTLEILDETIRSEDINDGTIASADISTGGVTSTNILDGTINTADFAAGSVTTLAILNETILTSDISTGGVTSTNILDGTIAAIDLSQMGASANQVLTWNGSAWAPASPSGTVTGALNGLKLSGANVILGGWLDQNTVISGKNTTNFYNLSLDSMANFFVRTAKTGNLYRSQLDMSPLTGTSYFSNQVVSSGVAGVLDIKATAPSVLYQGLSNNKAYVSVNNTSGATTGSTAVIGFTDSNTALDRDLTINNSGFFMKNVDNATQDYDLKYNPTTDEVTYAASPTDVFGSDFVLSEEFPNTIMIDPLGNNYIGTHQWLTSNGSTWARINEANHPGVIRHNMLATSASVTLSLNYLLVLPVNGYEWEVILKCKNMSVLDSAYFSLTAPTISEFINIIIKNGVIYLASRKAAGTVLAYVNCGAYTNDTWVRLRVKIEAGSINLYKDGVLIGTTTNLPTDTEGMNPVIRYAQNTFPATAKDFYLDRYVFYAPVTR